MYRVIEAWAGTPRVFLTLAVIYLLIAGGFFVAYLWNVMRYNFLGNYPYAGTDPTQFYYAKHYLRVACYQNRMVVAVLLALAVTSGLIYVFSQ